MTEPQPPIRDRIVTVRRVFPASRTFLFQAWTDQYRFVRWFGPRGWTVERCEVDPRAGGSWRAWFRKPDGATIYAGGVYVEVEQDRRLVFTWDTNPDGGAPESLSIVTVEFSDSPDGVEISLTHRKLTSGQAVDMDAGWNNTLDSLEEYTRAETSAGSRA